MNLFEIINHLSQSKVYSYSDEVEANYLPFMVNRGISQHYDTIMLANEMNRRSNLTKRQQHDFYHFAINPKKKRFAKWGKPEKDERIQTIVEFYKCSVDHAEQYSPLISDEDLQKMKDSMFKGGRNS